MVIFIYRILLYSIGNKIKIKETLHLIFSHRGNKNNMWTHNDTKINFKNETKAYLTYIQVIHILHNSNTQRFYVQHM